MFFSRAAYIFLLKGEKKTVGVQVLPNPAKQSLLSGGSRSDKKKRKKKQSSDGQVVQSLFFCTCNSAYLCLWLHPPSRLCNTCSARSCTVHAVHITEV